MPMPPPCLCTAPFFSTCCPIELPAEKKAPVLFGLQGVRALRGRQEVVFDRIGWAQHLAPDETGSASKRGAGVGVGNWGL